MKRTVVIPVILFLASVTCKDKGNDIWRGDFYWKGWIESTYKQAWHIKCDAYCYVCVAEDPPNADITLSKSEYESVYKECLLQPDHPPVDPNNKTPIPTGKVTFLKASSTTYGFDDWREHKYSDRINYLSIAAGQNASFVIKVDNSLIQGYDKVIAQLPQSVANQLSFSASNNLLELSLTSGPNTVTIYARSGVSITTPVDCSVFGQCTGGDQACLAGDCFGSEDRLGIVVYTNKSYQEYRLYLVNNPTFNPDSASWSIAFNDIIKQGIIEMKSIRKISISDMSWDNNGNNCLDFLMSFQDAPTDKDEQEAFLKVINEWDNCMDDKNSATYIFKNKPRRHWVITFPVSIGDYTIALNTIEELCIGDSICIGPWLNIGSGPLEPLFISNLWPDIKTIEVAQDRAFSVKGTKSAHSVNETFWTDKHLIGFTSASCCCVNDGAHYDTHVHEFLHQRIVGELQHPTESTEKDNIMWGVNSERIGTLLRYRALKTEGGLQSQWDLLH